MDTSAIGHSANAPAISIERIEKWFGTRDKPVHALAPTDLSVPEGELLVLLGPSGCGKTTLLRMIGGLLEPTSGALRIEGQSLWNDGAREGAALGELGMVFQEANLFPWLTIEDNIALPLELKGMGRARRIARAQAQSELPPMLLSFMEESRRLETRRMRRELRLVLRYPTVRQGLVVP